LAERGFPHRVVNASISGDTTSGGLSRLPAALERIVPRSSFWNWAPTMGLRGQPPMAMSRNLARMIELSQQAGAHR
jgi:acyl-CoA thioesterase-1